jgi:hypothetical protein
MVDGGFAEWRYLAVSFRLVVELQGHTVCLDSELGLPIFHGVRTAPAGDPAHLPAFLRTRHSPAVMGGRSDAVNRCTEMH